MESYFEDYFERLTDLHEDFIEAIEGLPQEALDWVPGEDMNSLCVLVVHTTGSARYWIGEMGFGEDAQRDRDSEFRASGLSVSELKQRFASLEGYVLEGLERLSMSDLAMMKSRDYGDMTEVSVGWSLLHALEHTGLHLGHAQITRQLWDQR